MKKGTKLFGQNQEKAKKPDSASLQKVRDFIKHHSEPDELLLGSDVDAPEPSAGEVTQPWSALVEKPEETPTTKGRGHAFRFHENRMTEMTGGSSHPLDLSMSESSSEPITEEFPLIEFSSVNDPGDNAGFALDSRTEGNPFSFVSPALAPLEASPPEVELSQIPRSASVWQEEGEGASEGDAQVSSSRNASLLAMGEGDSFTILDDEAATVEGQNETPPPPSEPSITMREHEIGLTLTQSAPHQEELQGESIFLGATEQPESSEETRQQKPEPFFYGTKPRQRARKTAADLDRQEDFSAGNVEEDVLLLSDDKETFALSSSESPFVPLDSKEHVFLADAGILPEEGEGTHYEEWVASPEEAESQQHMAHEEWKGERSELVSESSPQPRTGENQQPPREGLDGLDPCLLSFLAPDSFVAEQYGVLRSLVERLRGELGRSCLIAVTSPADGDGKTTTAVNLAGALAQAAGTRVLLIDAALHSPSVLERLGKQPKANRGLVEAVLHPRLRLSTMTAHYAPLNLTVLPAGRLTASSSAIFESPRFGSLLADVQREYDYIILDTPPLAPLPDCRLIEQWVDGFLVVVAAHKTPRKLVRAAIAGIAEEKILGLVFNEADPTGVGNEQYSGNSLASVNGDSETEGRVA